MKRAAFGLSGVVSLALLVGLAAASTDAEAAKRRCPKVAGALQSDVATVYVRSYDDPDGGAENRLVGCSKTTERKTVLGGWFWQGSSTDQPAPQFWLTGRYAAVNQAACPNDPFSSDPCVARFRVVDLRTGRRVAEVGLVSPIEELVLLRSGSAGFIHRGEVVTVVGSVSQVRDPKADAGSLAYAQRAGRLYWTSGGEARSLTLR